MFNTNLAVQSQKVARGLKISDLESTKRYSRSENKSPDQLC